MGSSGGSSNFRPAASQPTPPNTAGYGQTTPFQPHYVNFLGDTNVPSTGLTPQMLTEINATNGAPGQQQSGVSSAMMNPEMLRQLFAEELAKQQQRNRIGPFGKSREEMMFGGRLSRRRGGGDGGGYTTSGRSGAGSFGSRSSSASRAGGGLY